MPFSCCKKQQPLCLDEQSACYTLFNSSSWWNLLCFTIQYPMVSSVSEDALRRKDITTTRALQNFSKVQVWGQHLSPNRTPTFGAVQ